jgi:hypothetical protein
MLWKTLSAATVLGLWHTSLWSAQTPPLSAAYSARPSEENPPSVADWREDLDQIVREIRASHPDPFTKTGKLIFLREADNLKRELPWLAEEERVVRAMQLVALIGDGHTQLEPISQRFSFWYPIRLYEFADGFFVTSAHRSVADLAGAQVLAIAGRPISEVAAKARSLMGADNEFLRQERLYALHNASLMTGLGFAGPKGDLQARFKLTDGRVVERRVTPSLADDPDFKGSEATFEWQFRGEMFGMPFGKTDEWISAFKGRPASVFLTPDSARPLHLRGRGPFFSQALPQYSGYYIQVNQVDDMELLPSVQKALAEVDQLKPRYLIVDLRYNFGGDGSKVAEVINEFIKRNGQRSWGSLYVLTGRKTFSAAIMLLNPFLVHMDLSLIGEPPGAPLNSYGDATLRRYPRTRVQLHVSTLFHQLSASDDIREIISVDMPAMFSFEDYAAGRDPAVDPILQGKEMRGLAVIARSDGGETARRAWLARKERFASYKWWLPPAEADLRRVCQALVAEKRMTDALETCKLSTEIHPFDWHSWFNLGLVQRRMGKNPEAFASFQCVNKVDPNNHNAAAIRQRLTELGGDKVPEPPGCPVH